MGLCFISIFSFAQTPTDSLPGDPGALTVYNIQNLSFGAFAQGSSGGTVVVSNTGIRTETGSVVSLNLGAQYYQAIFEIEAPVGTIISISNGPDATLTGSNGGIMILRLGSSYPAVPLSTTVSPLGRTVINIGGTLTVGNPGATPPGNYTGTFFITFNQE